MLRIPQPVRAHATPICRAVCKEIAGRYNPVTTLKREEFAVGVGGAGYADIGISRRVDGLMTTEGVSYTDLLYGYEIKSAADSFARFQDQRRQYDDIFDYCVLITTTNHWASAEKLQYPHWGLWIARPSADGLSYTLEIEREPSPNPYQERLGLVDLLWKDELIEIMDKLHPKHGLRRYGKHMVRSEVLKGLPDDALKPYVYASLRARKQYWWNFEDPPKELQP